MRNKSHVVLKQDVCSRGSKIQAERGGDCVATDCAPAAVTREKV